MNPCRAYYSILRSVCRRYPGAMALFGWHIDRCETCQKWIGGNDVQNL